MSKKLILLLGTNEKKNNKNWDDEEYLDNINGNQKVFS
jgi:hypothetical protein